MTTPTSSIEVRHVFRKLIKRGQHGSEVLELQKKLGVLGYLSDTPTGFFGPTTEKALKKFQIDHDLDAFGYVGPGTRAVLNK